MSRSNNTDLINPAKHWFEWVGSKGCLSYYDKTKGEKGETVLVDLPFTFLVLDQLQSIKGFSDKDKSGYWSNEVRNTKYEKFTVRTKAGIVDGGLYDDLSCMSKGAKYNKSVYVAYYDKDAAGKDILTIGNISMMGAAVGPWIDLCKGKDIYKYAVSITGSVKEKKGSNEYYVPVFKLIQEVKPETEQAAIELDKQLQEYLTKYFNRHQVQEELAPADVVTETQKKDIKELEAPAIREKGDDGRPEGWQPIDKEPVGVGVDEEPDDLPF